MCVCARGQMCTEYVIVATVVALFPGSRPALALQATNSQMIAWELVTVGTRL